MLHLAGTLWYIYENPLPSLEKAGAKEHTCACKVVKCFRFSKKFSHKEIDQEQFSCNFQWKCSWYQNPYFKPCPLPNITPTPTPTPDGEGTTIIIIFESVLGNTNFFVYDWCNKIQLTSMQKPPHLCTFLGKSLVCVQMLQGTIW